MLRRRNGREIQLSMSVNAFPKTLILLNHSAAGIDAAHQPEDPEVQHLPRHPSQERASQKR